MDSYTKATQDWLNERFKKTDEEGVYIAHQPIYGYRGGPCEPNVFAKYVRNFQILKILNILDFSSFLEVGCAEGFFANLVRSLFTTNVVATDISEEALKRSRAFWQLETKMADCQNLPFADKSFDLVFSSETLEHVKNVKKAANELMRVARRYIVLTLPFKQVSSQLSKSSRGKPHAHLHEFDFQKIREIFGQDTEIFPIRSRLLIPLGLIIEGPELPDTVIERYPNILLKIYKHLIKPISRIFGDKSILRLIRFDDIVNHIFKGKASDLLVLKVIDGRKKRPQYSHKYLLNYLFYKNRIERRKLEDYEKKE